MKKKVKIFAIVFALILCMGATFGITMAFFGGNSTAELANITLKTGVKVGASAVTNASNNLLVPGQPVTVTATAKVEPYATTGTVVPALLRAKINLNGDDAVKLTVSPESVTVGSGSSSQTGYWVENTEDGYFYLCTSEAKSPVGTTQLLKFTPPAAGVNINLKGTFKVPFEYQNDSSGKAFTSKAIFEVAQGELYNGGTLLTDVQMTIGNATVQDAFTEVKYESQEYTVQFDLNGDYAAVEQLKIYNYSNQLVGETEQVGDNYVLQKTITVNKGETLRFEKVFSGGVPNLFSIVISNTSGELIESLSTGGGTITVEQDIVVTYGGGGMPFLPPEA